MNFSNHAMNRWRQRCPHLNALVELEDLRRPSKAIVNCLRRLTLAKKQGSEWHPQCTYHRTPGGAILIVRNDVVVTVYTVREIKKWTKQRDAETRQIVRYTDYAHVRTGA